MDVEPAAQQLNDAVTRYLEHEASKKFAELKNAKVSPEFAKHLINTTICPLLSAKIELILDLVPTFYTVMGTILEVIMKNNMAAELRPLYFDLFVNYFIPHAADNCAHEKFPVELLLNSLFALRENNNHWLFQYANVFENYPDEYFDSARDFDFKFVAAHPKHRQASNISRVLFEIFLRHRGFENVLQRLECETSFSGLLGLAQLLSRISLMQGDQFGDQEAAASVLKVLEGEGRRAFRFTAEQLKAAEFKDHIALIEELLRFLVEAMPESQIIYRRKDWSLDVAFLWIRLPYIQKRIKGLGFINDYIDTAKSPKLRELFFNKCHLEVQDDTNLIRFLFGDCAHPEITKRCGPLLAFLNQHNKFEMHDIDTIWASSVDKHVSIVHEVWRLFMELSQSLDKYSLDYLWQKIQTIPSAMFDLKYIDFTVEVTIRVVCYSAQLPRGRQEVHTWYSLDLFWEQATLPNPPSPFIQTRFMEALLTCLQNDAFTICRVPHMIMAAKLLRDSHDVLTLQQARNALYIIQRILKMVQMDFAPCNSLAMAARWLNFGGFQLLDSIFRIIGYMSDSVSKVFLPESAHFLREFLVFLAFYLPLYKQLELSESHFNVLWGIIKHGGDREISETIFEWLENYLSRKLGPQVSIENIEYNFSQYSSMDISQLEIKGFSLFETLFRQSNISHVKIQVDLEKFDYMVLSFELEGLDLLWEIAFRAQSPEVVRKSILMISNLMRNIANADLFPLVNVHRQAVISRCLARVQLDPSSLERSLAIMQALIDEFEKYADPTRQHGFVQHDCSFSVKYSEHSNSTKTFEVTLPASATVADLRRQIGDRLKEDPSKLKLTMSSSNGIEVLSQDLRRRLGKLPASHNSVIVNRQPFPTMLNRFSYTSSRFSSLSSGSYLGNYALQGFSATSGETAQQKEQLQAESKRGAESETGEESYLSFTQILSDYYFDNLFEKLALPSRESKLVWDMLMRLPTNTHLKKTLHDLTAASHWPTLLDSQHAFRLCYSLQIIDSFVRLQIQRQSARESVKIFGALFGTGDDSKEMEMCENAMSGQDGSEAKASEAEVDWEASFLKHGGLSYCLHTLLFSCRAMLVGDEKNYLCVQLLLKLICHFALLEENTSDDLDLTTTAPIVPDEPVADSKEDKENVNRGENGSAQSQNPKNPNTYNGKRPSLAKMSSAASGVKHPLMPGYVTLANDARAKVYTLSPCATSLLDSETTQQMVDLFIAMLIEISAIPPPSDTASNNSNYSSDSVSTMESLLSKYEEGSKSESSKPVTPNAAAEDAANVTQIARAVFSLLDAITGASEVTRLCFFRHRDFGRLLESTMLRAANPQIREFSSRCLMQLFSRMNGEKMSDEKPVQADASYLIREEMMLFLTAYASLLRVIESEYVALNQYCDHYFSLLLQIVQDLRGSAGEIYLFRQDLLRCVLTLMRNKNVVECEELKRPDVILQNSLQLARVLLRDPFLPSRQQKDLPLRKKVPENKPVVQGMDEETGPGSREEGEVIEEIIEEMQEDALPAQQQQQQRGNVPPGLTERYGPEVIEVLVAALFHLPQEAVPSEEEMAAGNVCIESKCTLPATRGFAFELLGDVVRECRSNYLLVLDKLKGLQKALDFIPKWEVISPVGQARSSHGHVGLTNLGTTCYINSLFQQLFALPEFCGRLLSVPSVASGKEEEQKVSLLYQLQRIIVNLKFGLKKTYSTKNFCMSYKDRDGQSINTHIQMDVDEFFAMLFDRIEGLLKGTPEEKLLEDVFGGETVNQIISMDCQHQTARSEPFFTLSLEVKDNYKIQNSLELYIKSDILEGDNKYHCSSCNAKVNAKKRCLINRLPRTLIIHLKRFEYDLESGRRRKVTQYCDFPEVIDMAPYTVQGNRDEPGKRKGAEDGMVSESDEPMAGNGTGNSSDSAEPLDKPAPQEYRLAGVLVHTGTTESGHYYSFVKDRHSQKWFQFNDDHVTPFDTAAIAHECYGGEVGHISKPNSAYMLFYERVEADETASEPAGPASHSASQGSNANANAPSMAALKPSASFRRMYSNGGNGSLQASQQGGGASAMSPSKEIAQSVWRENRQFLVESLLFDRNYTRYLIAFLKHCQYYAPIGESPADTETMQLVDSVFKLGVRFLLRIYSHSREKDDLEELLQQLTIQMTYPLAIWLLKKLVKRNTTGQAACWFEELFALCPNQRTRICWEGFINRALGLHLELSLYPNFPDEMKLAAAASYHGLKEFLFQVPFQQWPLYKYQFFAFLQYIIFQFHFKEFMANHQPILIHLVLHVLPKKEKEKSRVADDLEDYVPLALLTEIVCTCAIRGPEGLMMSPVGTCSSEPLELPDSVLAEIVERKFSLFSMDCYLRGGEKMALCVERLVRHLCWNNLYLSDICLEAVTYTALEKVTGELIRKLCKIYSVLLDLEDNMQDKRYEMVLKYLARLWKGQTAKYAKDHETVVLFLQTLLKNQAYLRRYLWRNIIEWIDLLFSPREDEVKSKNSYLAAELIKLYLGEAESEDGMRLLVWDVCLDFLQRCCPPHAHQPHEQIVIATNEVSIAKGCKPFEPFYNFEAILDVMQFVLFKRVPLTPEKTKRLQQLQPRPLGESKPAQLELLLPCDRVAPLFAVMHSLFAQFNQHALSSMEYQEKNHPILEWLVMWNNATAQLMEFSHRVLECCLMAQPSAESTQDCETRTESELSDSVSGSFSLGASDATPRPVASSRASPVATASDAGAMRAPVNLPLGQLRAQHQASSEMTLDLPDTESDSGTGTTPRESDLDLDETPPPFDLSNNTALMATELLPLVLLMAQNVNSIWVNTLCNLERYNTNLRSAFFSSQGRVLGVAYRFAHVAADHEMHAYEAMLARLSESEVKAARERERERQLKCAESKSKRRNAPAPSPVVEAFFADFHNLRENRLPNCLWNFENILFSPAIACHDKNPQIMFEPMNNFFRRFLFARPELQTTFCVKVVSYYCGAVGDCAANFKKSPMGTHDVYKASFSILASFLEDCMLLLEKASLDDCLHFVLHRGLGLIHVIKIINHLSFFKPLFTRFMQERKALFFGIDKERFELFRTQCSDIAVYIHKVIYTKFFLKEHKIAMDMLDMIRIICLIFPQHDALRTFSRTIMKEFSPTGENIKAMIEFVLQVMPIEMLQKQLEAEENAKRERDAKEAETRALEQQRTSESLDLDLERPDGAMAVESQKPPLQKASPEKPREKPPPQSALLLALGEHAHVYLECLLQCPRHEDILPHVRFFVRRYPTPDVLRVMRKYLSAQSQREQQQQRLHSHRPTPTSNTVNALPTIHPVSTASNPAPSDATTAQSHARECSLVAVLETLMDEITPPLSPPSSPSKPALARTGSTGSTGAGTTLGSFKTQPLPQQQTAAQPVKMFTFSSFSGAPSDAVTSAARPSPPPPQQDQRADHVVVAMEQSVPLPTAQADPEGEDLDMPVDGPAEKPQRTSSEFPASSSESDGRANSQF